MVGGAGTEPGDRLEEALGGAQVADVGQHVRLGADQLVRLGEVRRPAEANHLPRHAAGERVGGDAGEGVGAAALQPDPELGDRDLRASVAVDERQPLVDDRLAAGEIRRKSPVRLTKAWGTSSIG